MINIQCTTIRCPNKKSYDGHMKIMDQLVQVCLKNETVMETIETSREKLTITWKVLFKDPLKNTKAVCESMGILSENNIVPGKLVNQWTEQSCSTELEKLIRKIENHESAEAV